MKIGGGHVSTFHTSRKKLQRNFPGQIFIEQKRWRRRRRLLVLPLARRRRSYQHFHVSCQRVEFFIWIFAKSKHARRRRKKANGSIVRILRRDRATGVVNETGAICKVLVVELFTYLFVCAGDNNGAISIAINIVCARSRSLCLVYKLTTGQESNRRFHSLQPTNDNRQRKHPVFCTSFLTHH